MKIKYPDFEMPSFQFENAPTIQKMRFGFHNSEKILFVGKEKQIKCWVCDPEFIFIKPKLQTNLIEENGGNLTVHIFPANTNLKFTDIGLNNHPKTDLEGKIKVGPVEIGGSYKPTNDQINHLETEFITDKPILKVEYNGLNDKSFISGYIHYYNIKKELANYILQKYHQINVEMFHKQFEIELDEYVNKNINSLITN